MPPDRSRVLQQAQLLASRGQYEAAIAEWKKLAADSPADGTIHNTIGDLQLKRNASGEAATAFLQAASAFRAEGATLKAIAAFKKVLKYDPARYEVYRHLGDLNVERGLISSAVQDYLTLGKYYLKERRGKDALEVYKKIVLHDPSNLNAQQRVAELCVQENQQDEATTVYLQLGRERSAQGRYDEAKDAYLAVLRIDPANNEAAQFVESLKKGGTGSTKTVKPGSTAPVQKPSEPVDLLAEAVRRIDEKQYAGAEAILNQMLTREPGNPQVCQLLARLHLQRGDVQVALGEYRFLAGAALRAHDLTLAESLIQEFLSADPNSVPLLELKGELLEEKGDSGEAAIQYAKAIEILLEHPEPGMESLHEELFEKVRSLSSDDAFVNRLTTRMKGGASGEQSDPAQTASLVSAPLSHVDSLPTGGESLRADSDSVQAVRPHDQMKENQQLPVAGAKLDDVNPVGKDSGSQKTSIESKAAPHEHGVQNTSVTASAASSAKTPPAPQVATKAPVVLHPPQNEPVTAPVVGKPVAAQKSEVRKAEVPQPPVPMTVKLVSAQTSVESAAPSKSTVVPPPTVKEPMAAPDYETHYALGVAYKNMGLYEEAKEEFHVSMNSDSYYLDSALMTAVCLKEIHHHTQAILGLETVLADPRCQGAKGQAIRYELGLLYEAEEQWEKAAHAFESIPSFHDVPQRLVALKGKQGGGEVGFRYAS
ncbi:MAG: tetratricopeptide repeat protein [Nitrospira sp.]|nr:tetratricopeptide repeat protein [Nitrospira sp.]